MAVPQIVGALLWLSVLLLGAQGDDSPLTPVHPLRPNEFFNQTDNVVPVSKVVAGTPVAQGTLPGLGLILTNGVFKCVGTLISPIWMLTAGQCLSSISGANVALTRVFFNSVTFFLQDANTVVRAVSKVVVHPQFTTSTSLYDNDIGLVKLDVPVRTLRPVRLATVADTFADKAAAVYGFGVDRSFDPANPGSLTYSSNLLKGSVTVYPHSQCAAIFSSFTTRHLCAQGSQPACVGDTGAPLLVNDLQVALSSRYYTGCNPQRPSIYTRLQSHLDWIRSYADIN